MMNSRRPVRPVRQSGFTLIEALIAMVVLVIALLAMLSIVPYASNSVQSNSISVEGVAVAQQFLDDERNALLHNVAMPVATTAPIDPGYSYVTNNSSSPNPNTGYGNFTVTPDGCTTIVNTGGGASIYQCSVSVVWTEGGATRSVTVQSNVTK